MRILLTGLSAFALLACSTAEDVSAQSAADSVNAPATDIFSVEEVGAFDEPWAMTFLPNGILLITEKAGTIRFIDFAGETQRLGSISGVPEVDYGGQGGLGDIVAHPDFAENNLLYFSYVEAGDGDTRGAVVARATLVFDEADAGRLENVEVIWRQEPKVTGRGHYSHRIAFSPDGQYLFIASGERQKMEPAQDISNTLGTIVRLTPDGELLPDNPMVGGGLTTAQIWSYGHRNILGLAFSPDGRLWGVEHGPAGGDELNLVEPGANYGWPLVSNGDHYDGTPIPDHDTDPSFHAPAISWNPVIAPGGMIFYTGDMFPDFQGDVLIAGLASRSLVHVEIDGETAREAGRYTFDNRIREVEQGPDGTVWVLEDERDGQGGRLIRLTAGG